MQRELLSVLAHLYIILLPQGPLTTDLWCDGLSLPPILVLMQLMLLLYLGWRVKYSFLCAECYQPTNFK